MFFLVEDEGELGGFETETATNTAEAMDTATSSSSRRQTIGTTIEEKNKTDYSVYKLTNHATGIVRR
jgi:hypothetical protein